MPIASLVIINIVYIQTQGHEEIILMPGAWWWGLTEIPLFLLCASTDV